ncbi:hypothetical protein UlMin_008574 [Ulmus minor]
MFINYFISLYSICLENNYVEAGKKVVSDSTKTEVVTETLKTSKRTVRGPTYMPRVVAQRMQGRHVSVQINGRGQLVGRNAAEMQSFIGVVAHQTIPLAIRTWPTVHGKLKNKIWEQIQKAILSSPGENWIQFKSTLVVDEILPNRDNPAMLKRPPKTYNFISQKDWESFIAIRLSSKYMKMHEEAIARVREKKHQYRIGRKGYANTEVERHELWKIAHRKKNGEYANDVVREIAEKIVSYAFPLTN